MQYYDKSISIGGAIKADYNSNEKATKHFQ